MTLKLNGSSDGSVSLSAPADTSPSGTDVTLTLPTSDGDANQVLQTNGSGALSWVAQTTNTNTQVVQAADTSVGANGNVTVEFTGIPAGVRRICMQIDSLSTNATSSVAVQIGSSSGYVTSGYVSDGTYNGASSGGAAYASGFTTSGSADSGHSAATVLAGHLWFTRLNTSNEWVYSGLLAQTNNSYTLQLGGNVDCNGTLDRIKIFNSGSNQFDNGNVNILYES